MEATADVDEVIGAPSVEHPTAAAVLDRLFQEAEGTQTLVNLSAASMVFAIGEAVDLARRYPGLYLRADVGPGGPSRDDIDFAVRGAVFDLAHRLRLGESAVHAHEAEVLSTTLPRVATLFRSGLIGTAQVRAAVQCATGVPEEMLDRYDERIAALASRMSPQTFARACRRLHDRLAVDTLQERHDRAAAERRIVLEPCDDGMAWLHAYLPAVDAIRIDARLSATATRLRNAGSRADDSDETATDMRAETRTKAQLRADVFVSWAAGDGTPTAAKVHPYVLVDAAGRFAELQGYGPIDARAGAVSLRDAPSFRRVMVDPFVPVQLQLDRRRYRPTKEQRAWLTLSYGLDEGAADLVSFDAEIDHVTEFQHGGRTDVTNLLPLIPRLHRLKSVARISFARAPTGGGIRVTTPTGHDSHPPPF